MKELPMICGVDRPLHGTYVIVYNIIRKRFEDKFRKNFLSLLAVITKNQNHGNKEDNNQEEDRGRS